MVFVGKFLVLRGSVSDSYPSLSASVVVERGESLFHLSRTWSKNEWEQDCMFARKTEAKLSFFELDGERFNFFFEHIPL